MNSVEYKAHFRYRQDNKGKCPEPDVDVLSLSLPPTVPGPASRPVSKHPNSSGGKGVGLKGYGTMRRDPSSSVVSSSSSGSGSASSSSDESDEDNDDDSDESSSQGPPVSPASPVKKPRPAPKKPRSSANTKTRVISGAVGKDDARRVRERARNRERVHCQYCNKEIARGSKSKHEGRRKIDPVTGILTCAGGGQSRVAAAPSTPKTKTKVASKRRVADDDAHDTRMDWTPEDEAMDLDPVFADANMTPFTLEDQDDPMRLTASAAPSSPNKRGRTSSFSLVERSPKKFRLLDESTTVKPDVFLLADSCPLATHLHTTCGAVPMTPTRILAMAVDLFETSGGNYFPKNIPRDQVDLMDDLRTMKFLMDRLRTLGSLFESTVISAFQGDFTIRETILQHMATLETLLTTCRRHHTVSSTAGYEFTEQAKSIMATLETIHNTNPSLLQDSVKQFGIWHTCFNEVLKQISHLMDVFHTIHPDPIFRDMFGKIMNYDSFSGLTYTALDCPHGHNGQVIAEYEHLCIRCALDTTHVPALPDPLPPAEHQWVSHLMTSLVVATEATTTTNDEKAADA